MEKVRFRNNPEHKIQKDIIRLLERKGWYVKETIGSIYQKGFPDLFATHASYGMRWIEVKNGGGYWHFTRAQIEEFPELVKHGTPIWILFEATESEYKKLFEPFNFWNVYLSTLKIPQVDKPTDVDNDVEG